MNSFLILFVTVFAFTSAAVIPLDKGIKMRILNRERRDDDPKWYGNGGGVGQNQQGYIGLRYPNGTGVQVSNGVDAMIPIWYKQSRYGDTTLNAGGGIDKHFGGAYGKQMIDNPLVHRDDDPKWYGNGGGIGQNQQGYIGLRYPNGAGGQLSYGHAKDYGHDVSVDAMVPIWSKHSRYGDTTLNAGGGITQHFGGPYGNQVIEKRIEFGIDHRF